MKLNNITREIDRENFIDIVTSLDNLFLDRFYTKRSQSMKQANHQMKTKSGQKGRR